MLSALSCAAITISPEITDVNANCGITTIRIVLLVLTSGHAVHPVTWADSTNVMAAF